MKRFAPLFILAAALIFGTGMAHGAAYPSKPISYLITFNPGGESDIFARAQQPHLEKALGQSVLISYKTGGGGSVGWSELVRSKPDGYSTAGFNLPHIVLQPLQRKNAGYQTEQINPVMIFLSTPSIIAVKNDSPYKTLGDLLKAAKEKPGAITLGGSGSNTPSHIAVVRLNKAAGVNISYVPFTGTGDVMPAFLGGHVTGLISFTSMGAQYSKEMRILAVATEERFPLFPEVPTLKELGFDIVEGAYRGLAVPPGTPKECIDVLYKACLAVNNDPKFAETMVKTGFLLENFDHEASKKLIAEKVELYKGILADLAK